MLEFRGGLGFLKKHLIMVRSFGLAFESTGFQSQLREDTV